MTRYRILDTGRLSAAANMALDKIILDEVAEGQSPPTLRFLQFSPPAALVGYHQDIDLEIRPLFCAENGIDINRRLTGGGSIFFQDSALGWEIYGQAGQSPFRGPFEQILKSICTIAAEAISQLGIPAKYRPRNDIEVEGRKISGTGGVSISGAYMFQGTLLVKNEIDLFLKALRVPVEKLKKREIESLMERVCFLEDLIRPCPDIESIKQVIKREFELHLEVEFECGELTLREKTRLQMGLSYFGSPEWIRRTIRPRNEGTPCRSIIQTEAGTMRVHVWLSPGRRIVRQVLICGDFFTAPNRLIRDLEAALVGVKANPRALREAVIDFLETYPGSILGIDSLCVAGAIAAASERMALVGKKFTQAEVNELFFVNVEPGLLEGKKTRWLLLPYCAKKLDCSFRVVPGCDECGGCEIGASFGLARDFEVEPITIHSFEHLMEVLQTRCKETNDLFIGSCCEAFYAKHQQEMEATGVRGVLVNLDSTTCYDLGKGSAAYEGRFDNKTTLNLELIRKALLFLNDTPTA